MTDKEKHARHRLRHVAWHRALDELTADWALHHMKRPGKVSAKDLKLFSTTTIMELMNWSAQQARDPDELEKS